jgi:hypothetical protein
VVIWHIFPVLVISTEKNLATLRAPTDVRVDNQFSREMTDHVIRVVNVGQLPKMVSRKCKNMAPRSDAELQVVRRMPKCRKITEDVDF